MAINESQKLQLNNAQGSIASISASTHHQMRQPLQLRCHSRNSNHNNSMNKARVAGRQKPESAV